MGKSNIIGRFLKEYPSELLKTDIEGITKIGNQLDTNSSYQRIFTGKNVLPSYDRINKSISDSSHYHDLFEMPIKHHSSLHLVGTLSADNFYGSQKHLEEILKQAKGRGIFNLNIHLLIDNSFKTKEELLSKLQELENFTTKIKLGRVVTIAGRDNLHQDINLKYFKALLACFVGGKTNKSLSPEQIINLSDKKDGFSKLAPTSIVEDGYQKGRISGYDTVLFFDYNNDDYDYLINKLVFGSGLFGLKIPKSLNIFTLSTSKVDKIKSIFPAENKKDIFDQISRDNKIALISEISRYAYLKPFTENNKIDPTFIDYENNENNFYLKLLSDLKSKSEKYELTILVIPTLDNAVISDSMEKTIKSLNLYYQFLEDVEKYILEKDLLFILTSSYGRINNLNNKRDNLILPNFDPVPFIVLSKYKSESANLQTEPENSIASNYLNLKHDILDVAPTLLQMFGLDIPDNLTGTSLLN